MGFFIYKMGIKFFYKWLCQNYQNCIKQYRVKTPIDVPIDTLLIDMNGVFHNSAQRVFKYGNGAPKSLLRKIEPVRFNAKTQLLCFEEIARTIDNLVMTIKPQKTLVLGIDGVAPASKINQQRQRRFRSCLGTEISQSSFNPIAITPGTKFMDYLSKYIDWYIHKRVTESEEWRKIKVVFSNEKCPGEGEHKLINYIREHGTEEETYCINALDADLVMLSLATGKPNFYLLRDDQFKTGDFSLVSIGQLRDELSRTMEWSTTITHDKNRLIKDFILVCFMCGNDFLPNIPSISIIENGLDVIITMYKKTCVEKDHLIGLDGNINIESCSKFLENVGNCEKGMLGQKIHNKNDYFPNPSLEKHTHTSYLTIIDGDTSSQTPMIDIDMDGYKNDYYQSKGLSDIRTACHEYIRGCEWVFSYYTKGVSDWTWVYPYNYSPFALEIAKHATDYVQTAQLTNVPIKPFEQLLCVIPPKSSSLLPSPLDSLLKSERFREFCPDEFKINCEGKKYEYEGIVELPIIDISLVKRECSKLISHVEKSELKRNISGKIYVYAPSEFQSTFRSFYGDITVTCDVEVA